MIHRGSIVFATAAGLSGFGMLFSLWGALYWRSQTLRQLPVEEVEQALCDLASAS